jgi:hypothetical protein
VPVDLDHGSNSDFANRRLRVREKLHQIWHQARQWQRARAVAAKKRDKSSMKKSTVASLFLQTLREIKNVQKTKQDPHGTWVINYFRLCSHARRQKRWRGRRGSRTSNSLVEDVT